MGATTIRGPAGDGRGGGPDLKALASRAIAKAMPKLILQRDMQHLAEQANAAHRRAGRSFLDAAREAGEALVQAKTRLGHGRFLGWVVSHCEFSPRTATDYMRVAERWTELEAFLATNANRQRATDFSLRVAVRILSRSKIAASEGAAPASSSPAVVVASDDDSEAPYESPDNERPCARRSLGPVAARDPEHDVEPVGPDTPQTPDEGDDRLLREARRWASHLLAKVSRPGVGPQTSRELWARTGGWRGGLAALLTIEDPARLSACGACSGRGRMRGERESCPHCLGLGIHTSRGSEERNVPRRHGS